MKKKLEAELISIAHRILKLKNRAELDQLQQETLKLYEKISVLRFVEDNFSDVKPTIGHASAEETLEEIYGIEETPEVKANEVEAEEEKKRAEEKAKKETDAKKEKKSLKVSENAEEDEAKTGDTKHDNENDEKEAPVAGEAETEEPEGDADPEQKVEEYQASEEEKEHTEEETDEDVNDEKTENSAQETEDADDKEEAEVENEPDEDDEEEDESEKETAEEPEDKVEVVKPEEERRAMEESAAAVFDKEDQSSMEEEEKAVDAEIITIEPDAAAKTEEPKLSFDFAFDRPATPEEIKKEQKEITFEDYHHDYKEPEFVKKSDTGEASKEEAKPEEPKTEEPATVRDWRDWEPSQSSAEVEKAAEPKQEEPATVRDWRDWEPSQSSAEVEKAAEPKQEEPKPAAKTLNDSMGKTITLGLNDRIAFEKNLFGGSGEDLNRVLSQLNTFDSFDDAKNFIEDLVKPDYNNWQDKEEYEERFMAIVEKKFD